MIETMGVVISMQDYLERKAGPDRQSIQRRLADIGLQQLLLASEKHRLEKQLLEGQDEQGK